MKILVQEGRERVWTCAFSFANDVVDPFEHEEETLMAVKDRVRDKSTNLQHAEVIAADFNVR